MTITVKRLKSGEPRFRAQYRKQGVNLSKTFCTRLEAKLWLEELDRVILQDEYFSQVDVKLDRVIDRYLREITPKKAITSQKNERYRLLRLARSPIAELNLQELTKEVLEQWQNERLQKVSANTVLREKGGFSAVLTQAVRWELIAVNPFTKTEKIKPPAPRNQRYSEILISKIVEASNYCPDLPITEMRQRVGGAFLLAIETAMRAGEICGLTWENINFEQRTAFLPKTKNGYPRTIPLSSKAIALLQHFASIKQHAQASVFGLNSASLDAIFRKIKVRAGLADADLHFHDTRREALSRLASKFNVMELAKISGHRDLRILQNTYYAPDISEFARRLA